MDMESKSKNRTAPPASAAGPSTSATTALPANTVIVNHETKKVYPVLQNLGYGAYAQVYLVKDEDDNSLKACKVLIMKTKHREHEFRNLALEIAALTLTDHPNIIKMYEYFTSPVTFCILMEYGDFGSVYDLLATRRHTLLEPEIRFLAKPMLAAVHFLHQRNLIHRDIKPANMLLTGRPPNPLVVKLCDFGISTTCRAHADQNITGRTGSPNYIAPEVLKGNIERYLGPPIDIWSFGCFLYALVYGEPPFVAETQQHVINRVTACDYTFPPITGKTFDPELKDWITRCLSLKPEDRPTAFRLSTCNYFYRSFIPTTHLGDVFHGPQNFDQEQRAYDEAKAEAAKRPVDVIKKSSMMAMWKKRKLDDDGGGPDEADGSGSKKKE